MQETKVARPSKAFGQNMHYQTQKLHATHGARGQAFGFAVAPTLGDLVAVAAQDVLLLNDAPVQIAAQVDDGLVTTAHTLAIDHPHCGSSPMTSGCDCGHGKIISAQ